MHKLVPEVWFENRWESTDPVRVVDLLEHTTGWDDMHLPEYAKDAKGVTLRQGLDYYQRSRVSRWRPGTRMSYCNSGPPVAAYIVEKITGQRFEDYVTENFFVPIGMKTATYFEQLSPQLTTLYHDDGKTPFPYCPYPDHGRARRQLYPGTTRHAPRSDHDAALRMISWHESRLVITLCRPPNDPPIGDEFPQPGSTKCVL